MRAAARAQGLGLRPHVKTHKTREGAALQLGLASAPDEGGSSASASAVASARIVVSTLREAEFLAPDVPDILYGVILEPSKFARAWALHCALSAFSVLVDSAEAAAALDAFAAQRLAQFDDEARGSDAFLQAARRFAVFLAVDATQYGREGVAVGTAAESNGGDTEEGEGEGEAGGGAGDRAGVLDAAAAVAVAISRSRRLKLAGIYSHSGNSYNACSDPGCASSAAAACASAAHHADARAAAARIAVRERDVMLALAQRLRATHGVVVPVVSIGATPSASSGAALGSPEAAGAGSGANSLPAVELHPGNYIFYDRQQVDSGSCTLGDIACYVLARVIARYPGRNGGELLIDAGGCAMHKDAAGMKDGCWGALLEDPTIVLKKMTQEVSVVGRRGGAPLDVERFPPGTVVRIAPNHSCMTAACHERYHVVQGKPRDDGAREIVAGWEPTKFW